MYMYSAAATVSAVSSNDVSAHVELDRLLLWKWLYVIKL